MSDPKTQLENTIQELENAARKIGLYSADLQIGATDPERGQKAIEEESGEMLRDLINDDEEQVLVMATFSIGDQAFSKRVLDPEQDEVDNQARAMLPDPVEEHKRKIQEALESGKSIFELGDNPGLGDEDDG